MTEAKKTSKVTNKLTLLGTGSFFWDAKRADSAYLLEVGDKKILIDAGSGIHSRLENLGIKTYNLDYIFLTHFHPDHATDLFSLVFKYKLLRKYRLDLKKDILIYGPEGVEKFINDLHKVFRFGDYIEYKGIKVSEIQRKRKFLKFTVTPFRGKHMGIPVFGYKVEVGGKVIVFAGDTEMCDGLRRAVNNADIFVADCSFPKGTDPKPHMNTTQIGRLAKRAKVKKVILSHILPATNGKDLVSEVKEEFDGEVVLGKDLMEIEL